MRTAASAATAAMTRAALEPAAVEKWRPWRRPPDPARAAGRATATAVRRAGRAASALVAARGRAGAWTRLWAGHATDLGAALERPLRQAALDGLEAGLAAARAAGLSPTDAAAGAAGRRLEAWAAGRAAAAGREMAATSRGRWEAEPRPGALDAARRGAAAGAVEAAGAALEGEAAGWAAAGAAVKRWRRTRTDSCAVCLELDGKAAPIRGEFRAAGWRGPRPPAHPFCACRLEFPGPRRRR